MTPFAIWVVPPAMVSEREDSRGHSTDPSLCAEQVERQLGHLLTELCPHALGQARRAERVTAVQRRRDRALAQQLEVVDAYRELAKSAQVAVSLSAGLPSTSWSARSAIKSSSWTCICA